MQLFNLKGITRRVITLLTLVSSTLCVCAYAATAPVQLEPSKEKDIRVIIDMSGSMKKNDPNNHRTKAVQLFSEILPTDVMSGIWTFASDVNMLVKHEKVTNTWKKSAFKKAKKIHSFGLYTNIEKALKVATKSLHNKEQTRERHVILLTDGFIDISKNKGANKASRERFIKQLIPQLRKSGIVVHSIALSDQADHELLKKLSNKTSGQYAVIKKASDLDRYFFKLFQSTAKPDTVPLKSNRFDIDKSINDMTIVLFNANNPTELVTPEKKKWTHSQHPKSVKWVKSENYEIITVSKPPVGSWYVDAPIDPDNKIMVVTNLKLRVNKLPTLLLPGDHLDIKMAMTEKGEVIKKDAFIKLIDIKNIVKKAGSLQRSIVKASYEGEGVFSARAQIDRIEDIGILLVSAKSPTFTREFRHDFTVINKPVLVETKVDQDIITLLVYVDDRAIDTDHINLVMDDSHNKYNILKIGGKWKLELSSEHAGKNIEVLVDAKLQNGKPYKQKIPVSLPVIKKEPVKVVKQAEPVEKHKEHELNKEETKKGNENIKELAQEQHEEVIEEEDSSLNWIFVLISVLLLNAILIVGGYFIYKKFFKSNKEDDDFLLLNSGDVSEDDEPSKQDSNDDADDLEELDDLEDMDSSVNDNKND